MREAVALLDEMKNGNIEEMSPLCHRFEEYKRITY